MKITVAIPTIAGREKYLASCLETCISQDDENMEILVSDNSVSHAARELVNGCNDSRIRYISPDRHLPMSMHWDFIIPHIDGDAFTIIGDDDGLMPGSIHRVRELYEEYGLNIVHHTLCNYRWPDFPGDKDRNTIQFFHDLDHSASIINCVDAFKGLCAGSLRYVDGPMAYHNFIPTNIVLKAMKDNKYFNRSSPDVYSAVAISSSCKSFLSVGECLTISGQGSMANGVSVKQSGVTGNNFITEMQEMYKPRFNSRTVQLALLDCIYEVCELNNRTDLLCDVNIPNHLARAIFELKSIRGAKTRLSEIREIFNIAAQNRATSRLLALLAQHVISGIKAAGNKVHPGYTSQTTEEKYLFSRGNTIRCDESVTNIYQASLFLSRIQQAS
jgi:glycosyltransferase involved in cell wall biosynthesis